MSIAFANLAQATVEDRAAVTNITTTNSTLKEKVALYINLLSTKEADNMALQTAMKNLQGEVKNLKAEVSSIKRSVHSGGASTARDRTTRPPGGAPHTVGYMGQADT